MTDEGGAGEWAEADDTAEVGGRPEAGGTAEVGRSVVLGEQGEISAVLVALADPTRRQLLDVLVAEGNASATTLAGRLPVSRQAVVKHLNVLEDAGLVAGGRAGREVLYRVQPSRLDASARWLAELAATWDRRLAAIKRIAEAAEGAQA